VVSSEEQERYMQVLLGILARAEMGTASHQAPVYWDHWSRVKEEEASPGSTESRSLNALLP
jgi:hypothetical protein